MSQIFDKRIEMTKKLLDDMTAKRDELIKARVDFVLTPPQPRPEAGSAPAPKAEAGVKKEDAK